MSTVNSAGDAGLDPRVQAVFDDIRATRKSDFINNVWRGLANQPDQLERTWNNLKEVMVAPGELDPLVKELIYLAVSTTNGCSYCIHSHTAAARTKGMTPDQHAELLAVIAMASQTNALATALRDNIQQRQWMCGFPDKVAVAVVGEYVVSVFGAEDLVDTFMSHLNGIFGVQPVYDEAIL